MVNKRRMIKVLLGSIISTMFLSGCAALAVGAVGAVAGTTAVVATDVRSPGVVLDDNTIEAKLRSKYITFKDANIYVTSYDNSVLLTGTVPNAATNESALFEAKAVPGVNKIYNYLEIRLPQSLASRSSDALITTQIRAKIFNLKGISSNHIKVITTNSVVYLFGVLTPEHAQEVARNAASVNRVKKVITLFEYVETSKIK